MNNNNKLIFLHVEKVCFYINRIKFYFYYFYLVETVRLEDQPLAEDQQALLAEFERRRRVRKEIL